MSAHNVSGENITNLKILAFTIGWPGSCVCASWECTFLGRGRGVKDL